MPERQVLMIAYDFPPGRGIGSGLRSGYFARYLPQFGWQTKVIALDTGQAAVNGVDRLASPTPWHEPYEITPYGWALALRGRLKSMAESPDLVYVSCPPFPQALAAGDFARARGIPLVVDFRDAWSLDPYQEGSRLKRVLYRYVFPLMEKRLLQSADLLLLNTPSALAAYRERYPQHAMRMAWLPNGYDEMAFSNAMPRPQQQHLQLLYAGRFGIGARSPGNLLKGMVLVRERGCNLRLQVLGEQRDDIREHIRGYPGDVVQLLPEEGYAKAVSRMCSADVLVLIQAPTRARVQAVAGKTYDYLRAGRPVLAVAPPGDNINLLQEHCIRVERADDNPRSIADALECLYRDWEKGELPRVADLNPKLERFERRNLAQELAGYFDRLADDRKPGS